MNTLRAFQGTDTAYSVVVSPITVDFTAAPALMAEIHRGDGSPAVATVDATWIDPSGDKCAVAMPGATTKDLEVGHYFLSVRTADGTAQLSFDTLAIYPAPQGTTAQPTLVAVSEMVGVVPEILDDLAQLDAMAFLARAATEACESYCDRPLIATTFDEVAFGWISGGPHRTRLRSWPVQSLRLQSQPVVGLQLTAPASSTRGVVSVTPNSETDLSIGSLTLTASPVPVASLVMTNYATIADLAAAATLAGWTATTNYPTYATTDLVAMDGPITLGAKQGARIYLFANDLDGYRFDPRTGQIDITPVVRSGWYESWASTDRGHYAHAVRRTYRAGYDPVPKELKTAGIMMALHLRESAKVAGPVLQQGMVGRYYTIVPKLTIPLPLRTILDKYAYTWGID